MFNPLSTYRIQFNKDYNFKDFKKIIEYLSLLGTGSVYASPVFEAVKGSMHGYDITNPHLINPELGSYNDFVEISEKLKTKNIGWIQDIVPNHMAFHMNNQWLMDVLEKGLSSSYAGFFDIDFKHPDFKGRVMVPFLGKPFNDAVNSGEIIADWKRNNFIFRYFDFWFPFNYKSFRRIIKEHLSEAPDNFSIFWKKFESQGNSKKDFSGNEWTQLKEKAGKMYLKSGFREFINRIVRSLNDDKYLLAEILDMQHYQLSYWAESTDRLNYRRFFTVNTLICLKMENDSVYESYHTFIEQQVLQKRFNGLRIDHLDGLKKPLHYIEKLRLSAGEDCYIVAEKILQKDEELIPGLPVQGTSGYDYLGIVNNLFTCKKKYHQFRKFYRETTGINDSPDEIVYNKKKFIITESMQGELDNLSRLFVESGFSGNEPHVNMKSVKEAIGEFLILFPVYKLYSDHFPVSYEEKKILREVFENAVARNPSLKKPLDTLQNVFLYPEDFNELEREKAINFFLRCMQFTGPVMAKGVEDTAMYHYNCFICHNEVGDDPRAEGISVEEYHKLMIKRLKKSPMTMNATSTHDTKRGEDVRARLNVISEMPEEWSFHVKNWMKLNQVFKMIVNGSGSPTLNEEYFIYQTLTGVFPVNGSADDEFLGRMDEYLIKSLREAKTNTSWNEPNEEHEKAVITFTRQILDPENEFLKSFVHFQRKISHYGIINSLSQLILKSTSPGIPDFYQGTELWDLSMVDPDNRRPVDFTQRLSILHDLKKFQNDDPEGLFAHLFLNRTDGRIKLWMTHQLMQERRSEPDLFIYGKYIPLAVKGKYKEHILAFARVHNNKWLIVIVPLFLSLLPENKLRNEPGFVDWENTRIKLPGNAPKKWSGAYSSAEHNSDGNIFLSDVMMFPCPLILKGNTEVTTRAAGILAHISSLPGKYGTGDLGDEAYEFADILRESGQTYWQILPLNPVDKGYGYSPYSSISAFAGNLLFISPDFLFKSGLLQREALHMKKIRESDRTNFKKAQSVRNELLEEAFSNFKKFQRPNQQKIFNDFCKKEKHWLDDYALFIILKREFNGAPWIEWIEKIKNRDKTSLKKFIIKYEAEIEKEKYYQYLFNTQWKALKLYCNNNGIKLIGDISFYVNFDSTDVWANPEFFKLDDKKNATHAGGVPPDYFSSTGQLWGMPVYNWDVMKTNGYKWWMNRIKRNLELCDIVRFDHFRGFSEHWEVPASEKTAVNGRWASGPGNGFFEMVKKEFPEMPFIAEDLGSIDQKVVKLRDDYSLPGMVVLQFAFGDSTPHSIHTLHNHTHNSIVYTGTHDNNTIKGWYVNDLDKKFRKEAEEYTGHKIRENTAHLDFIRMAYSSVARIAIIPVQDILGLDKSARLNKPSSVENNWSWKMTSSTLKKGFPKEIRKMAELFGRI